MAATLKLPDWQQWLRVAQARQAPAVLSRRHIYILPTRYGVLYAAVLIAMLIGAINYALSLGFALTFLLAGLGNMAMLHSWRNLANLSIEGRRTQPVFAGEEAIFEIAARDHKHQARHAVAARLDRGDPDIQDIPADSEALFRLRLISRQRGWLQAGRITFFTEFPLALFHVWSYVELDSRCLVYPAPAPAGLPLPTAGEQGSGGKLASSSGDDDFAGHRNYQPGDSLRRVDWKASSREQGLLTKQFQGEAQRNSWLDWQLTPGSNPEQRISQLTRWVIDAHAQHLRYGLRLPKLEIAPHSGEAHYHQCLQVLALVELA